MAPRHVTVYGNDHSPWVQSVLLALHDRAIPHTLVTVPPLRVFVDSGVLMPAARFDDGPWLLDSGRILEALDYPTVPEADRRTLGSVFGSSALRRTDDAWAFWTRFSRARDGHPHALRRHWNHFWRAFSIFYFFVLIRSAGARMRLAPDAGRDGMLALQDALREASPFFGGDAPNAIDFQLFGLVQMLSSIPVPELEMLQTDPKLGRLRRWIGDMRQRFSAYEHFYGARDFDPAVPAPAESSHSERVAFWLGAATMWLALPVTIPLVFFFVGRIRRKGRLEQPAR